MKSLGVAFGSALAVLVLAMQPVMAQAHPGSGEHGGGGGHSYSGGGGGAHSYSGHAGAGYSGGGHYAARSYSPSYRSAYAGSVAHYASGRTAGLAPSTHFVGSGAGGIGRNVQGHFAPRGGLRDTWRGGYWGGRFWPGVFWGANFAWFLPVLPFYATYWYGGVPYYYYNDVYYTWDPTAAGYVVTNPPPASDSGGDDGYAVPNTDVAPAPDYAAPDYAAPAAPAGAPPTGAPPSSDNLYAYPKSGQSDAQQTTDRRECEQWASSQTGSASAQSGGSAGAAGSLDFRRALTACMQGRSYSVD